MLLVHDSGLSGCCQNSKARPSCHGGRSSSTATLPVLLDLANEEQSWREYGVSPERVVRRLAPPIKAGCPALWGSLGVRLEQTRQQGWFGA